MRDIMRKILTLGCAALLLSMACCGAMAAGVTVRTFTPFADLDMAAQSYMDMITAWEEQTGNVVEDYSGLPDEAWLDTLRQMAAAGEADIVIVPPGAGLAPGALVTVDELFAAVPDLGVRKLPAYMEADGSVVLTPVRMSWEALYVNTDVLKACGLGVPGTYEELIAVCSALAQQGVWPVANALGDWAEIVLDCLALAAAPAEAFGTEASLSGAQQMLAALVAVGAFGSEPASANDMDAMQAFLDGRAAMRFDSDFLAGEVSEERQNSVIVIPMPQRMGEKHGALPGMPGFGLGITRSCWAEDERCEAALVLVRSMLSGQIYQNLAVGVGGALGNSIADMLLEASDCAGILYDRMAQQGMDFDSWAEGLIASTVR